MPLIPGRTTATITGHNTVYEEGKDRVVIMFEGTLDDGDPVDWRIYISDKSAGIARKQLQVCGFDVDAGYLNQLDADPPILAGRVVPLKIEEYNGTLRAGVVTSSFEPATADKLDRFQQILKKPATGSDGLPF